MPESQAQVLREMMRYAPLSSRLDARTSSFQIDKKDLKNLTKGDILILPLEKMELLLVDSDNRTVAIAEYGEYKKEPSVLINEIVNESSENINTKKYEMIFASFGYIRKSDLHSGKIVRLSIDSTYDITLYANGKKIAYASLADCDDKTALMIEERV